MRLLKVTRSVVMTAVMGLHVLDAAAQAGFKEIALNNLDAFREPSKNWVIAGDVAINYLKQHDLKPVKGEGILVNTYSQNNQMHLYTKEEFGDIELELDFLMAKNSNAGVYLQGRYEIQMLDSWQVINPTTSDAGAVYARWTSDRVPFEGSAPVMNVAKAPGLWQKLRIQFKAPQFNEKGEKVKNARFVTVYLNDVLVQQEVEVTGPTAASMFTDEKSLGPIVIQGDHGPLSIRNIRYKPLVPPTPAPPRDEYWIPKSNYWNTMNPMLISPTSQPAFIKTFLMYGDVKLTHVLSVGSPNEINYSYDVKQGGLFQIWRGEFIDVTPAWHDRAGMQIGVPLGSIITLPNTPVAAILKNENDAWPDSVAFDDMHNKGYVLDRKRSPSFEYTYNNLNVTDKIEFRDDKQGLSRSVSINNAPAGTYCRVANGSKIEKIADHLYAVNDRSYYISIDKKLKPVLRQSGQGWDLIVKYNNSPINWSLIW